MDGITAKSAVRHFIRKNCFEAAFILAAIVVVVAIGCATRQDIWFESTRPIPKWKALVLTTDDFPNGCDARALGCYIPEDVPSITPGRIYVRPHLAPWDRQCVLDHEEKHHGKPAAPGSPGVPPMEHEPGFEDCG